MIYKKLYAYLLCNQSDAISLLQEGRVFEAIDLLKRGLLHVEEQIVEAGDILPDATEE